MRWRRRERTPQEFVETLIEADKALRQRDAAVRHALGKQIIADIDSIAMNPTWDRFQRMVVVERQDAIKNLVAKASGLPPTSPRPVGIERND